MSVKTVKAVVNGQTYNLTYNSETQRWEAPATAPDKSSYNQSGHYYSVQITAEDMAGNVTEKDATDAEIGDDLQLIVKEKVAPTCQIISPTSGQLTANSKPEIKWTVTDDDSGVNANSIVLLIDDEEVDGEISKSGSGKSYTCTYTPTVALGDGSHKITVRASDNDGNVSSDVSLTFRVLATAPNLSITTPEDNGWFKNASVAFSGTTDGATLKVIVGDGEEQAVEISEGAFSDTLTLTAEGANTVKFIATSASGVETTVTRTLNLDTKAPKIISVQLVPNPVDASQPFTISVEIED